VWQKSARPKKHQNSNVSVNAAWNNLRCPIVLIFVCSWDIQMPPKISA